MHEIMKYFLLTENQKQFLNSEHVPDPANPAPICVILMRSSWYSAAVVISSYQYGTSTIHLYVYRTLARILSTSSY